MDNGPWGKTKPTFVLTAKCDHLRTVNRLIVRHGKRDLGLRVTCRCRGGGLWSSCTEHCAWLLTIASSSPACHIRASSGVPRAMGLAVSHILADSPFLAAALQGHAPKTRLAVLMELPCARSRRLQTYVISPHPPVCYAAFPHPNHRRPRRAHQFLRRSAGGWTSLGIEAPNHEDPLSIQVP